MKKYIAVFCGSAKGSDPIYQEAARRVGKLLVEHGYGIVYGGGNTGLMSAVADGAKEAAERLQIDDVIIGVITTEIKELGSVDLSVKLIEEKSYLNRKARMAALSIGFIALPGGLGTLDEWIEMAINNQFASYENSPENPVKPLCLLNVNGFYDGLLKQLETCTLCKFLPDKQNDMIFHSDNIEAIISYLNEYKGRLPDSTRWWEE